MKKKLTAIILACILLLGTITAAGATTGSQVKQIWYRDIIVTLNGKQLALQDVNGKTVEPFIIDGTTYLPVRAISNALGLNVDWNSPSNQVILSTGADVVVEKVIANCSSEAYGKAIRSFTFKVNSTASLLNLTAADFQLVNAVYDGMEYHDVFNAQATNIYFTADSVTVEVGPFYPSRSITREGVWQLVSTNKAFNVDPSTEMTYIDSVVDSFVKNTKTLGNATTEYYLYTPDGEAKNMPLVLFNSGGTGISPTGDIYGANFAVSFAKDDAQTIMPAYVLYPQRNEGTNEELVDAIKSIIDGLVTAGKVDPNRIYITGESAGGGFTFDFLDRYPGYFAAAAIFNPMRYTVDGNMKTLAKSGTKVMLIESIGDDDSARPEDVARIYNALKENGMEPGVDLIWHYYTAETFNALTGDNTNWLTMNDGSYVTDPITGVTSYIYPGSMLHNSSYPGANDNYIKVWLMNQSKAEYSVKFDNGYSAKYYTEHPEEGEDYSIIPDYYTKVAVLDDVPLIPAGETGTATVYTDDANEHWYIVWEGGFGPNRGMQYVECIVVGGVGYVVMDCSGGWWTADITSGTMPHLLSLPSIDWQPYAG